MAPIQWEVLDQSCDIHDPSLFQRWVLAIKTHAQAAVFALACGVWAAQAEQVTLVNTPSESWITCPTNLASETITRKELSDDDLLTCFWNDFIGWDIDNIDLNTLPDEVKALAGYWNSFTSLQKDRVLALYEAGESPIDAVAQVHDASTNEWVPEDIVGIKTSIIKEATANGIDLDFDLPGLEVALDDMQKWVDLRVDEIELIIQYAPQSWQQIPVVVAYIKVNGDLNTVNGDLNTVNGDLKTSEDIKWAMEEIKEALPGS